MQPFSTLALNAYYTYLEATNDVTDQRLVRRPRNTVNLTATWAPLKPLTLTLGGLYINGRQDFDAITGAQINAPDYFILRASASYQINEHVSLWVRGENLTDRSYQPAVGFLAPGIAGYGGVRVSF